jgi:hypothetical protein
MHSTSHQAPFTQCSRLDAGCISRRLGKLRPKYDAMCCKCSGAGRRTSSGDTHLCNQRLGVCSPMEPARERVPCERHGIMCSRLRSRSGVHGRHMDTVCQCKEQEELLVEGLGRPTCSSWHPLQSRCALQLVILLKQHVCLQYPGKT